MHNQHYHSEVKVSSIVWQALSVAFGLICVDSVQGWRKHGGYSPPKIQFKGAKRPPFVQYKKILNRLHVRHQLKFISLYKF